MEQHFQQFDTISDERYMFIRNNIELYSMYTSSIEKYAFEKQHKDFIETLLHYDKMKNDAYNQYNDYKSIKK